MNEHQVPDLQAPLSIPVHKNPLRCHCRRMGLHLHRIYPLRDLEPAWTQGKLDQVVGRAIRYGSHSKLKPKDRTVTIYRYTSLLPKQIHGMFLKTEKRPTSVDQYLKVLSDKKQKLNQEFLNQL